VTPAEARAVLGVGPDATPEAIKSAYRGLVRVAHPDVAGPDSTVRSARLNEAYRVLRADTRSFWADSRHSGRGESAQFARAVNLRRLADDTLGLEVPAHEAFMLLHEAGHRLGHVSFVDRESGLLEVIVDGSPSYSLFVSFQGRGDGTTEAFCTVEALGPGTAPAPQQVIDLLLHALLR
jgi:curved DNA-binding protein CbpA